jgi:hypothetical protein
MLSPQTKMTLLLMGGLYRLGGAVGRATLSMKKTTTVEAMRLSQRKKVRICNLHFLKD